MNRKIQIMTGIIILLIIFLGQISYAIPTSNNSNFFTVNTDKIEPKDTLKISFNLSKIEYDNFKIVLNSNIDSNKIQTNDNVTVKEEANAAVIEIDKTKMNLGSVEMSYVVPEESNSNIQLSAKVIVQEEVEEKDDDGNTIMVKQEKTIFEESKNITVIEKPINDENAQNSNTNQQNQNVSTNQQTQDVDTNKQDKGENINQQDKNTDTNKENNNSKEKNYSKEQDEIDKNNANKPSNIQNNSNMGKATNSNSMQNTEKVSNKSGSISMNFTNTNSSIAQANKNVETATYNGSNNNYLKKLKVKGVELNTKFNKENTTYFINVTDTSNINVTATAEDNTAKVTVIGNDSIKEGINKILIAVTAENVDIRYYRIFVNCEKSSSQNKQATTTLSSTSEIKSALIENIELHATYYLEEIYVENNSYVKKGDKILKYTNGTYLTAPYDCYIAEINVPEENGKVLNSHYVKIQSKNVLSVSMQVSEKNIGKINVGQEAEVTISALEKTYKGYVTHVGSTATNGNFTVDIELEDDGNIMLGMTSTVEISI